ncbi:tuberoinfundibular peptide of 39 residues [Chelmon rostratus]|uniref:tuberoinfundibular peptide of 39 residues n=1 Tax=Chelmon rostratus TaxID=109905 RepID=UPI001BEB1C21|nr:tuberoinfundibular peptide of 39 residues [Chelmon rostratus]
MSELPAFPRMSILLLCTLGMTWGFPQPGLPLRTPDDSVEPKQDDYVLFPSISLHDWSIQMMSAPSLRAAADSKAGLMREAWLFAPERAEASMETAWPDEWSPQGAGTVKRNMVVADDAAFREKSKLLTSMERQKWLNSYMQKLLVVNSS